VQVRRRQTYARGCETASNNASEPSWAQCVITYWKAIALFIACARMQGHSEPVF
jgi:hypothetical protein